MTRRPFRAGVLPIAFTLWALVVPGVAEAQERVRGGEPVRLRVKANGRVSLGLLVDHTTSEHFFHHGAPGFIEMHSQRESVRYYELCDAPCDLVLEHPNATYFFLKSGGGRSRTFDLVGMPSDVTAEVDVGSPTLRGLGGLVAFGGAVLVVYGALELVSGLLSGRLRPTALGIFGAGTGLMAGGVAIAIAGRFDFDLVPTPR